MNENKEEYRGSGYEDGPCVGGRITNRQAFARCCLEYALAVWKYDRSHDWKYLEFEYWLDDDYQHVGESPRKFARKLIDKRENCS